VPEQIRLSLVTLFMLIVFCITGPAGAGLPLKGEVSI
jgi:hypothetical protein